MKKKVISLALSLAMLLGLCVPIGAREADTPQDIMATAQRISAVSVPKDDEDVEWVESGSLLFALVDGYAYLAMCDVTASGTVTIPAKVNNRPVVAITADAFAFCEFITKVVIPDSVQIIDNKAFAYCSALTQAKLPASLNYIGIDAFTGTPLVKNNTKNGLFRLDGWLLSVDESASGYLTIPVGTKGIGAYAFLNCNKLTCVTLPDGLRYVCSGAFYSCSALAKVIFTGDAPFVPGLSEDVFFGDTVIAYYPADNTTWNAGMFHCHGGTVSWTAAPFVDLLQDNWYDSFCMRASDKGIMGGVGANRFDPDGTTTRAMLVQILYSLKGKPAPTIKNPFTDVPKDAWFTKAILWAYETGVTAGTSPTTFDPNAAVTREQVAQLLYAFCGKPKVKGNLSQFADAKKVDSWAVDALIWATQSGIINGSLDNEALYLHPISSATRAQTATMMLAFVSK